MSRGAVLCTTDGTATGYIGYSIRIRISVVWSMSGIPIRPAQPRDLAAITRIYDHAVRHGTASFEIEPPDESEMARRYEALRAGGYPYLVAELDGDDHGLCLCRPLSRPAGLSLERRGFDLYRAAIAAARDRPRAARAADRRRRSRRLPADDRGDRRFRQCRLDRAASRRPASAWSARSTMSASSSAAGSTAS